MEIKRHEVVVDKADPFKNDWLNRKPFADQLTNIVKNNNAGKIVLGLSGQWGEGKTAFVKMWKAKMESEGIPCIYFDAFEYDYMDNVFLSIAVEVYNFAKEKGVEASSDYLETSKNLFSHLQKIKMKTPPIQLDTELVEQNQVSKPTSEVVKIADTIEDNLNSLLNNAFEQALKQNQIIGNFKRSLSTLASNASKQDLPLVIIIDELDRCKPSFAVEILEKVKHLFLVENVIFVLSMHHEQLEESIKKIYGQNIDAHTYLQKFIDYPARLPKTEIKLGGHNKQYFQNQIDYLNFKNFDNALEVFDLFVELANHYNLSYRQVNKALYYFKTLINSEDSNFGPPYQKLCLFCLLSILKVTDDKLLQKLRDKTLTHEDIMNSKLKRFLKEQKTPRAEELNTYIDFCFRDLDYFRNNEDGRAIDFFNIFRPSKGNGNILSNILIRLESFETY